MHDIVRNGRRSLHQEDIVRIRSLYGLVDPTPIPGWFGHETAGGGVAIADLDSSGRPDLIVFHIDNAKGENRGYYRVGRDMDAQGNVAQRTGANRSQFLAGLDTSLPAAEWLLRT